MKKFSLVFVCLLALSVSVFFGACGSKYKNLKMYLVSDINCVQLMMDDEYLDFNNVSEDEREVKDLKTVEVKIDGIKQKYIGKFNINVIPSDLAEIKRSAVSGDSLYFVIQASRAGDGEIKITHLASGKTCSIDLRVDKKAITAISRNKGIVLNIPSPNLDGSENINTYTIDPDSILNFDPIGSSDNVEWEVVGSVGNGVQIGQFDNQDENILKSRKSTQIKVSSNATESSFNIKPTLKMEGYDPIPLDFTIPVTITKVVNDNNLRVLSRDAISTETKKVIVQKESVKSSYKELFNPIYLFTNSLKYASSKIYLFASDKNALNSGLIDHTSNLISSSTYQNIYIHNIRKSSSQIEVSINSEEGYISIAGIDYNENGQWFEIDFVPNNCVGNIEKFTVRQEVVLTESADNVSIFVEGVKLSTSKVTPYVDEVDIDLLDYYEKNNGLGQKLNFNVYRTSTHSSMKTMQLVIDKDFYDDGDDENGTPTNSYVLEFKKGKVDLKFTLIGEKFYSQSFTYTDNIYLKYAYNEAGTTSSDLTFYVQNIYDGSLGEKDIDGNNILKDTLRVLNVNINRGRGIKSMAVSGAFVTRGESNYLLNKNDTSSIYVLNEENGGIADYNSFNLANNNEILQGKTLYGFNIGEVKGHIAITDTELSSIDLHIKVLKDGVEQNVFDLAIFKPDTNGVEIVTNNKFKLPIVTNSQDYVIKNVLMLVKKDGVNLANGNYVVEISEPVGGYKTEFYYNVVTNVLDQNFAVSPFDSNNTFTNSDVYYSSAYKQYLFGEHADQLIAEQLKNIFIVPTAKQLETSVRLDNDSFKPYIKNITINTSAVQLTHDYENNLLNEVEAELLPNVKYVSNDRDSLIGTFNYDINLTTSEYGTIKDGQKYFIKVTYKIHSDKYVKNADPNAPFYEIQGTNEAEQSFYFFIYLSLGETKFANDGQTINTYFYDDLGYYFKEDGTHTLTIDLPNKYKTNQSVFDYVDYSWFINSADDVDIEQIVNDKSLTFTMKKGDVLDYRDRTIKAIITQFGVKREIISTVHVKPVNLTESLVVRNSLNNLNGTYYTYLKENGEFAFNVDSINPGTFKGLKYVVCDLGGNVSSSYYVDENGNLIKKGDSTDSVNDLKVLIFSKDWVVRNLESTVNTYDFNDLSAYTFNKGAVDYSKRVKIIDIKIRDGSALNPYLVSSVEDFKEISKDTKKYYYEIVNDINLSGLNLEQWSIEKFEGALSSYKDYKMLATRPYNWEENYVNYYTYSVVNGFEKITSASAPTFTYRRFYELNQNVFTLYNIALNYNNVFKEVAEGAEISNINFRFSFASGSVTQTQYIGLIGKNKGTLTNIKVEYSGNLQIDSTLTDKSTIYVGMLVALNEGNIVYDNANTVYSTGSLTINDLSTKNVYIGGLVGENNGLIAGTEGANAVEGVEYAIYYENQGSLFDGNITVETSNANSTLGGVVGFNNGGYVKQVFTSGKVVGCNNVGGIIGKNASTKIIVLATKENSSIVNSLSTTQVYGSNNVGGVTGLDAGGSYYHVYYEVYNNREGIDEESYAIKGNKNVGGLIGFADLTQLNYCYFHSFRWTYAYNNTTTFEQSEFYNQIPDIYGDLYVGGLIGYADSKENTTVSATYGDDVVYISNSVVDAYVIANINIGGIIGRSNGYSIFANGYVQGAFRSNDQKEYTDLRTYNSASSGTELTGVSQTNTYRYLFGKNEGSESGTYVYTLISENIDSVTDFEIDTDCHINNGRPYLLLDGKSLITIAPTSINLDSALQNIDGRTTNVFNGNTTHTDKILIYYYNLINNGQANFANDSVQINLISLDEIVNKSAIGISPAGIGARLKVTSSDESIVQVTSGGYIKLIKEGICTLTFASLINPSINDEITIIVRAMPSDYNIYKTSAKNEILDRASLSIVKDESKFIYEDYVGKVNHNNTDYYYNTTNYVKMSMEIKNLDESSIVVVNGKGFDENNKSYDFYNKEPIIISVLNYSKDGYSVVMTSYIVFKVDNIEYYVEIEKREFTLLTKHGVTNINTNVTDAVMSVADSLNVELSVITDLDTTEVNIDVDIRDIDGNVTKVYANDRTTEIDINKLFTYDNENKQKFDIAEFVSNANNSNLKTKEFVLKLNQNVRIEEDLFVTLIFSAGKVETKMYLTLIPQKISSIVASAYRQSENNDWKLSSVIRPGEPGIIMVNVSPDTAYFEYLEITDTYSNEKISFIQWSEFSANKPGLNDNGQALSEVDKPSSDGYGIRLVKTDNKTFYVHALLSVYATNNDAHKVLITAYSSSGYALGSSYINIEAMLFPTVVLSYYNENDEIESYCDSREGASRNTADLAVGIEAKIGVNTYNTDGSIKWEINDGNGNDLSNELSIEYSPNGYYYLTYDVDANINNLVGKTIYITANVKQTIKGMVGEAKATLIFNIKRFTLNGVTAKTSRDASNNRLGAIVGEETYLEFYFNNMNNKNISFYQNGEYFNNNNFVDFNDINTSNYINELLKNINNFESSEHVSLRLVDKEDSSKVFDIDEALNYNYGYSSLFEPENKFYSVELINSSYMFKVGDVEIFSIRKTLDDFVRITVYSSSINSYALELKINYYYLDGNAVVGEDNTNTYKNSFLVCKYDFNVVANTSDYEYTPIRNSEEFMNMIGGGRYILVNDITLKNYKMLNVAIKAFDGNGHTITIDNFDYESLSNHADGTKGYLGLFKQVAQGSIVENLTVKYNYGSSRYDLSQNYASDNTDYTEFYFGGVCALNYGIITNCKVEGSVTLATSKISPAHFYLGGLVAESYDTAYITNCTVSLVLDAGGIVGGIACENQGKIVTTNFIGSVKAYTTTNTSLSNEINAACFVVNNSGEISLSYVAIDSSLNTDKDNPKSGVINSGGSLGGFAYINSGSIYDCYLKDITFSSRGYMGGFVYKSSGTIERCYVDSASTLQGDRYIDIFVYDKTSGVFKDCFYILSQNLTSSVDGIRCIVELDMLKESHYTNFGFSKNGYNVWIMNNDGPALANCGAYMKEKVTTFITENGVDKMLVTYSGTKENPYIIYDIDTFNMWFTKAMDEGVIYGHFRFVADIDFKTYKGLPITSNYVFSGTIEGNNMKISNFNLFTAVGEKKESIGMFKEIRHNLGTNYVNNLELNCTSVRASTTMCVGVLAGIIDGGYIYNVVINSPNLIVLGQNAVGGLAGIIKGNFIVENIKSNVGANASFRQTTLSKTNIYNGRFNTNSTLNNIEVVSYAGGIAGIVEGYDHRYNTNIVLNNYYTIKNCTVSESVTLIGETVGGLFGFVNERARVSHVSLEVSDKTYLQGLYYSGGIVGENRGIIDNAKVNAADSYVSLFDEKLDGVLANCVGGIVAVNYGGLLYNCINNANVITMYTLSTAGGIVGRNVAGSINSCANNGAVYAFYAGNIAGSDYTYKTVLNAGNARGTVTLNTISVIDRTVDYSKITFEDETVATNGYTTTLDMIDSWFANQSSRLEYISKEISSFYSYNSNITPVGLYFGKVLGAVIGITDKDLSYDNIEPQIELKDSTNMLIVIKDTNGIVVESDLTNYLEGKDNESYYYFVAVDNCKAYDFYNLVAEGYNDEYARIVKKGK